MEIMGDNLFYLTGKFLWSSLSPANLMLALLLLGCVLAFWTRSKASQRLGRRLVLGITLIMCLIACVPFGVWGIAWLENRTAAPAPLPEKIAGIIVIGGSESENIAAIRGPLRTSFSSMNRLVTFTELARHYPKAQLIYAGGTTRVNTHAKWRQADIARAVLEQILGRARPVLYERESRTTYENALNAAAMIGEKRREPWILVTSAFHMPRALSTFRHLGWNVTPMPADYLTEGLWRPRLQFDFSRNLSMLQVFLREMIGIMAYYLGDKSDQGWP
jgi:uncharacterized SAM-binding protein YcdF (DUF218 family)